jgi:uncharacterized protein YacL
MAERRSKPLRQEPAEEEEDRYNWWQLSMMLVAAIGIILLMVLVSMFLSGKAEDIPVLLYYAIGAAALVAILLWFMGWLADRKAAQ